MIRTPILLARRQTRWSRAGSLLVLALLVLAVLFVTSGSVAAQEPLEPPAPPDANRGLPLFAERCANCHGPEGKGDGEMADRLPAPPRDYTDEAFRRSVVPSTIFQTITDGRLDAGMPPFGPTSSNPIDSESRWDLVATVYSLGIPPEAVENGRLVYEENCLACHGETGQGDGHEAAASTTDPGDLSGLRYWFSRSNEMVFAGIIDDEVIDHTFDLDEAAVWDAIDYMRTFSYVYADPQAVAAPVPLATITGVVTNGTTDEIVTEGTVSLRAFTRDLQEALSMTTSIAPDGRYAFELADADPDWVYLSSIDFGGLNFSSSPERLERSNPLLDLPIMAFETTQDPGAITINQVHMLMDIAEDRILINEIYVLSNSEPAVYVGESGDPQEGTLQIALPAGAENVQFQRSFRSFENFLPAPEIQSNDLGYADTIAIRPGEGVMNLLATYEMPYEDGMTIAHPIFYETNSATVVLPDVGLELQGNGWTTQGSQQMGAAGSVISYAHPPLSPGEPVSFSLEGRPALSATVGGTVSGTDATTGILVGGVALLFVAGGAAYVVRNWRSAAEEKADERTEQVNDLLISLVDLDESYEAGDVEDSAYEERRQELISELAAIWVPEQD